MNSQNLSMIRVKSNNPELDDITYTVEYMLRINDLRTEDTHPNSGLYTDGIRSKVREREVLNDHVDEFIEYLDRNGFEYTTYKASQLQD